jgi:AbiJ N-terminal domain 4
MPSACRLSQTLGVTKTNMKTFSQRNGLKPVSEVIQTDGMNETLRASLWNVLDIAIWSSRDFMYKQYGSGEIFAFSRDLWFHYFKKPVDSRPEEASRVLAYVRKHFFDSAWNEVYDFIEFVVRDQLKERPKLAEYINIILEREVAGYRIVGGHVVDITSEQEVEMLELALRDTRFSGPAAHLQRALELFGSRDAPDYRNSIKESVSAVESMAKIVAEDPKATLPDALKALERKGQLHAALKDGFIKLYGYTSAEDGIRHAMLDEPDLDANDARFFLLSCTSFVNYLKARLEARGDA